MNNPLPWMGDKYQPFRRSPALQQTCQLFSFSELLLSSRELTLFLFLGRRQAHIWYFWSLFVYFSQMAWCSKFGVLRVDKGRDRFLRGSNTQALFGWCLDGVAWEGSPLWSETFQRQWRKATTQKGTRMRELPGESEELEEGAYVFRWCHSATGWRVSGSESSKRQLQCGVFL